MRCRWKVGVTDNHVEQAHIERCFRELNSHLRPILVNLAKKLDDWTQEGKSAWDQLLALDIDDLVMINYPKKQKLNFSNIGPFKVVERVDNDFFVVLQSLTDVNVRIKVKANRLLRFKYDPRVEKVPIQIAPEDRRDTQVIKILSHEFTGEGEFKAAKGQRKLLKFLVLFETGEQWVPWEQARYLEVLDVYLDTNAFSRTITSLLRTKDKNRKTSGPMFSMVWREAFDNSFMVKSDGVALSDMEL